MEKIFITHSVGPSKLDLLLADAPDLSEESKEKVILIIDIVRLAKLLGGPPPKPHEFYALYDSPLYHLQQHQHDLQVAWNTKQYNDSVYGKVPPNF